MNTRKTQTTNQLVREFERVLSSKPEHHFAHIVLWYIHRPLPANASALTHALRVAHYSELTRGAS